ncbi:MAG: signal recognition particle-docking protein FtsY, partial [Gammaproteobacteria bacterium]
VAFDAWQAAHARGTDVLIIDTAGRLHTQDHLMAELGKLRRVLARHDPNAPHETLLVLDGHTGQNALMQAREFTAAIGTTGLVITKLDGSAKGGAVVAITRELGLPVRFIGLGENIEDLEPFNAADFAAALVEGAA